MPLTTLLVIGISWARHVALGSVDLLKVQTFLLKGMISFARHQSGAKALLSELETHKGGSPNLFEAPRPAPLFEGVRKKEWRKS